MASDLQQIQEAILGDENKLSSSISEQLCRRFSFYEIRCATNNFDDAHMIGKGGFGKVYKGHIEFGKITVAIKRLESKSQQGAPEFWTEINMLSKFRHCHLVSLIGYCNERREMILVYEYLPNGTLADHLHKIGKNGYLPLSWFQRLKISIGAARGLDYLHTGTSVQHGVVHRDVKSTNILLDENWAANVSDFGLSKICPANQESNHVTTAVKGTFGYMDPEYFLTCRLTRKSDVFAFGVVLFEVLCGRPAVDLSRKEEQQGLAGWAQHCIKEGTLDHIIDPSLSGQILPNCLSAFVKIAKKCLQDLPKNRPTMAEVVVCLEFALALQEGRHPARMTFARKVKQFFSVAVAPQAVSVHRYANGSRNSKSNNNYSLSNKEAFQDLPLSRTFTFAKLKRATRNFSADMVLGEGGFGIVFKGWIDEWTYSPSKVGIGMAIAVKKHRPGSLLGLAEAKSEVQVLGKFSHPNLIKLLGFCFEDEEMLLVYEYMPKGSLASHLFKRSEEPLPWLIRLKIAIGAARCLAFLHTSEIQIIHRHFKAANILLDGDFNAKVSGFGLAKLGPTNSDTHFSTRVMGTMGYAAPAYIATGHLYVKSDVYRFGVVLLEMLTGMRSWDATRAMGKQNLVDWARPFLTNKIKVKIILDPQLKHEDDCAFLSVMPALILKCLSDNPKNRPSMEEVLETLEQINSSS